MHEQIINDLKSKLEKAIKYFQTELTKVRTSRPSHALIEDIEVECFGKKMPLKRLAAIAP